MGISSIGCIGHVCWDCGDRLNCSIYQSYSQAEAEVERLHEEVAGIVGLMAIAAPFMVLRPSDPIGMAQEVVAEAERLRSALRIIRTWGAVLPPVLDAEHVVDLCDRALAAGRGEGE